MKEIIMDAPSVIATLNGRKTQTRRVIKEQPLTHFKDVEFDGIMCRGDDVAFFVGIESDSVAASQHVKIPHPVGAKRYVKESYFLNGEPNDVGLTLKDVAYAVDLDNDKCFDGWAIQRHLRDNPRNPFSMPQWASRCHIEIVGVRVERVQSISDADVMAEGCIESKYKFYSMGGVNWFSSPHVAYKSHFIKIHGKKAWDSNPWVFVYDYKVIWKKEGN